MKNKFLPYIILTFTVIDIVLISYMFGASMTELWVLILLFL